VYDIDSMDSRVEIRELVNDDSYLVSTRHDVVDRFTLLFYYRRNTPGLAEILTFELLEKEKTRTVNLENRGIVMTNLVPSDKFPHISEALKYEEKYGDKLEVYLQPRSKLPMKIVFSEIVYEKAGREDIVLYLRSLEDISTGRKIR
jgi:hypothetical protein